MTQREQANETRRSAPTPAARPAARSAVGVGRPRVSSPIVGRHRAGAVPVGASAPPRLFRASVPDAQEREARAVGPALAGSSGRTSSSRTGSAAQRPAAHGAATGGAARGSTDRPGGGAWGSADGAPATTRRARATPRPDSALGAGRQLTAAERTQFEPALEVDLSGVRVHDGAAARRTAAARGAHAFTFGNHIVLGRTAQDGGPGPRRQVLAHELVHVRQQSIGGCGVGAAKCRGPPGPSVLMPPARAPPGPARVQCWDAGDLVPGFVSDAADAVVETGAAAVEAVGDAGEAAFDWVLDGVRSAARALPGYSLIADVIGRDPLTGERVTVERSELVELVLTYGPFGPAVAAVLTAADVIGDVFDTIATGLATNNLTFDRIVRDVASAFDEFTLSNGIDANLAILRRYLDAFLSDIASFVGGIADRVIEIVRSVAATLVEPLLETEPIKPVWDLARQVLHFDPLRGTEVQTPTVEILASFLRLIGQEDVLAQMQERGTLQETADWLDTQFATFFGLLAELAQLFSDAWDAIQPANLPNLLDTLPGLVQRAFGLVQGVASFAITVIAKVLELVKAALLGWLAEYADQIPGFHLISVILERNPFTGEVVLRTAENLIRGFITLLPGGAATYESLAESGVIGEAAARIEGAMTSLGITWELVTSTFLGVWDLVTLAKLLDPIGTFVEIVGQFGEPIARIVTFVGVVVRVVVELILRLMNFPVELLGSIISNVLAAIADIQRDPVGFLVNLIAALRDGFVAFFANIVAHLAGGLQAWLFRGLGELGITIPSEWSLAAALDLVLQVLGLTMEFLWRKLGEHIGEQRVEQIRGAIDHLTGAWAFIRDVQERGMAALWDVISSQLGGLWTTVVSMAMEWIMTRIIASATVKLLSFLDPTGIMAIINGTIAFFNAVQSAIEYLHDMLEILNMYVSTLASVAAGNIEPGARMIEQGLAAVIPIAIGFLAKQVGLGGIPDRIVAIIEALRETVEQAVDWLITQALRLGAAALNALGMGGDAEVDAESDSEVDTQQSISVKARAGERLAELIPAEADMAAIERAVDQVFTELQPEGLHSLETAPDESTGGLSVVASASRAVAIAELIPRVNAGQGSGATNIAVRLTLSGLPASDRRTVDTTEVLAGGADLEGRQRQTRTTPPHVRIRASRGAPGSGLAREAAGGARTEGALFGVDDNQQDARFWSIGGTQDQDRCESHAERAMDRYLRGLSDDTLAGLRRIDVELQPKGPCESCGRVLVELIGFLREKSKRRNKLETHLVWTEGYWSYACGGTTDEVRGNLGLAGWLGLGPDFEPPTGSGTTGSYTLGAAGPRRRG